jgi:4-carboxymuconolactone decarboxylase
MSEETGAARAAGRAKMDEVYGFSVDPDTIEGPYVDVTVDHLFGAIWTREALDIRDRRMLTIGVLAALGQAPLLEIQFRSALERGECTEEQVREIVLHLAHYIGWPLSTGVNAAAEKIIAQRRQASAAAASTTEES